MGVGAGQTVMFTVETLSIIAAGTKYVYMPFRGRIISVSAAQSIALTVADSTTLVKINGTTVIGATVLIEFTGAVGEIDTSTPTGATKDAAGGYFEAGDAIELENDAGGTAGAAIFTVVVSAQDR